MKAGVHYLSPQYSHSPQWFTGQWPPVPETCVCGSSHWISVLLTRSCSPWTHVSFYNLQLSVTMNPTAFTIHCVFGVCFFFYVSISNFMQWLSSSEDTVNNYCLYTVFMPPTLQVSITHKTWSTLFPGWEVPAYQLNTPCTEAIPIAPLLPFEPFQVYSIKDEHVPWNHSVAKHWFLPFPS